MLAKPTPLTTLIDKKIAQMTVDEKVGQLFIVGFPQKTITPDLEKFIGQYKPGAYLLFKRNIVSGEQIRDLNTALYKTSFKYSKLPPLIAIDQEGGSVSRLPITPAPPNALALGQTQSPLLAEEMGYQTGLFLREVGFNMNLAPVLDVTDPLSSSFIGVRSFGSDPQLVGELGVAYSKGLLKARVIPTAKHFPGTGNLKADPHTSVVQNTSSLEFLKNNDLRPYESYAKLGDRVALMLSHLIYPALDESREPASFSKKISTSLLREELQYKGLVVTDDLQMQGSKQLLRPEAAALKALQAGADIVMLTWSFADQGRAFEYVKNAVHKNELKKEDLDNKLRRILTVKAFANLYRRNPSQSPLLQGPSLTSKDYSELESNIFALNLKSSLIPRTLPTKGGKQRKPASTPKICVVAPSASFIKSFKSSAHRSVDSLMLAGDFKKETVAEWMKAKKCSFTLAAVTGPRTSALVRSMPMETKKRLVVVNLGSPRLVRSEKGYLRVLQLYFNHADSGKKIAQHLDEILRDLEIQIARN
ncbi:glycoside hydrolase family 3 protein [Bdellovibrio sp. 22V]|uniref:glycoside hydrolase family 3 protein n=1 Tax=Bdellovibrio sp. 22V TaxID=3044166 RepID=UPI002543F9F3|nr:glycoside hydrolase family 3 protein [Bdellovibrio sp. 22V]WII73036.1 glycoside hydrolase family 3 protein [Bdellovibrio sp. 22V]